MRRGRVLYQWTGLGESDLKQLHFPEIRIRINGCLVFRGEDAAGAGFLLFAECQGNTG